MRFTHLLAVGVVTDDLDATVPEYAKYLGIEDWTVDTVTADRITESVCHQRRSGGTYRTAFGATDADTSRPGPMGRDPESIPFEIVEPTGGETPFNELLLSRGTGIAWLTVLAEGTDADVEAHFAGLGIGVAHRHVVDGRRVRRFWDTRAALGGYLLEVVTAEPERAGSSVHHDGQGARGEAADGTPRPPLPVQGINHFGVVVDDTMAACEAYHRIFGIEKFAIKTWQTEVGRLDAPYYRDQRPVQHGYFTAQGFVGDLGFEIIQCTYGDSHYNREFTDQRGPGIHHMFSYLTADQADWDATVATMTDLGAGLCMGSDLRGGAAEYGYFDTFDQLRGFLIEGVVRRFPAEPQYLAPDWEIDYATLESRDHQ